MDDYRASAMSGLFDAPEAAESDLDEGVKECLPPGSEVLSVKGHGASLWTRSARVDTKLAEGTPKSYFLKVATGDNGRSMMRGEFESSKAINAVISGFAPGPVAWGTFKSDPDLHFFLQDFHEMDPELPDREKLASKLAEMHTKSSEMHLQMKAPYEDSGKPKFGFHVTTHMGSLPQDNRWTDTWEEFWVQGFKRMLELEEKVQGPQPEEMKNCLPPLFEKVIPRLLRPMETDGSTVKPSLIHGDLWHGNVSTDIETNEPIVYDECCFWGHNENDLRSMQDGPRHKLGRPARLAYLANYPPAFPVEDFDSRNALYQLRYYLHDSALFPKFNKLRPEFVVEATKLINMYPDGYEGWLKNSASAHSTIV